MKARNTHIQKNKSIVKETVVTIKAINWGKNKNKNKNENETKTKTKTKMKMKMKMKMKRNEK
jgi:hypothetical protein